MSVPDLAKSLEGEYMGVLIDHEEYGIRTSHVSEVVDTPVIRRIPKAPPFVAGVANIRGRIVPLVNVAARFGSPDAAEGDLQKLVLIQLSDALYGLMVHGPTEIMDLSEEMIELVNPMMVAKDTPFIAGIAQHQERLMYLLDLEAVLHAGLDIDEEKRDAYQRFTASRGQRLQQTASGDYRSYLSLSISQEEYGIELSRLREVILTNAVEPIGTDSGDVFGIVRANEGVFPVLDMQRKFGLRTVPHTDGSRVVIVDTGESAYGMLVNAVNDVLTVAGEEIRTPPAVISRDDAAHIQGVAMLHAGERLVLLLDETRILTGEEMDVLAEMDDTGGTQGNQEKATTQEGDALSFLIFRVADVDLALELQDISEVASYRKPTVVPKAPAFVSGIISVKGEMVSVLDLRKRFDLPPEKATPSARIIVVRKQDAAYGIIAESISGVLTISENDISSTPETVKGIDSRFIEGLIAERETDRVFVILNVEDILQGRPSA